MFLDERVLALLRDRHSLSFDIGSKVEPAHDANLAVQNLHQRNRHFAFGRKVLAIVGGDPDQDPPRSEEHTSELQSLMRTSYAVFCLKKKTLKTAAADALLHLALVSTEAYAEMGGLRSWSHALLEDAGDSVS